MRNTLLLLFSLINLSFNTSNDSFIPTEKDRQCQTGNNTNIIFCKLKDNNEATEVAIKFINDYVKNCNRMNEQIEIINWVEGNSNISNSFKSELHTIIALAEKNDPEIGLGFDPIFDAQDYPEEGFRLSNFDTTNYYLTVEGIRWKEFKITMKVIKLKNDWVVDGCGIINIPAAKRALR
ncbi:hypothetical protein [Flammeovirga aprica]|uniref:DUF3828 domain-containing protein n=1 Tax=Flammeovirga aprica JL-4 TaxID=694437 RepID=A0A7X9P3D1_9BACT|nr:hypothetical protein [Flammeovirga aprica]NME68600.1 hypothetical protein [Flammeovirga aprica JL-4]